MPQNGRKLLADATLGGRMALLDGSERKMRGRSVGCERTDDLNSRDAALRPFVLAIGDRGAMGASESRPDKHGGARFRTTAGAKTADTPARTATPEETSWGC